MIKKPRISVVLNVFKRSHFFNQQLEALQKQTIRPLEILVWENGEGKVPDGSRDNLVIARSSKNLGVWSRFAFALNAQGDYICVLDDDTIPGEKWLENCYKTMLKTPGLLGTRGLIFESPNAYSIYTEVGVYSPNEETKVVDIVGHSWFFKRSWLTQFWLALEDRFEEDLAGEDIHFSYVLQRFLKIPTLVPPHPIAEPSLWGSIPVLAKKMGSGKESISQSEESLRRFENALQHYRNLGFKTIAEVQGTPARYPQIVYKSIRRFPLLTHEFSRIARRFLKH